MVDLDLPRLSRVSALLYICGLGATALLLLETLVKKLHWSRFDALFKKVGSVSRAIRPPSRSPLQVERGMVFVLLC